MLKKQKRCSLNCKTYLISNMTKFAMKESNKSAISHQKNLAYGKLFPWRLIPQNFVLRFLANLNKIAMENRIGQHIILPSFVNEFSQYTLIERISNYGFRL